MSSLLKVLSKVSTDYLRSVDPDQPHALSTRLIVCGLIAVAFAMYYGVLGVIAGVVIYLVAVELSGLPTVTMMLGPTIGLLVGCFAAARHCIAYWRNYGH